MGNGSPKGRNKEIKKEEIEKGAVKFMAQVATTRKAPRKQLCIVGNEIKTAASCNYLITTKA